MTRSNRTSWRAFKQSSFKRFIYSNNVEAWKCGYVARWIISSRESVCKGAHCRKRTTDNWQARERWISGWTREIHGVFSDPVYSARHPLCPLLLFSTLYARLDRSIVSSAAVSPRSRFDEPMRLPWSGFRSISALKTEGIASYFYHFARSFLTSDNIPIILFNRSHLWFDYFTLLLWKFHSILFYSLFR